MMRLGEAFEIIIYWYVPCFTYYFSLQILQSCRKSLWCRWQNRVPSDCVRDKWSLHSESFQLCRAQLKNRWFFILVPVGCVSIGIIGMLLASYITSRDSASQTLPFLLIGLRSNSTVNFYSPMRPYFVRGMRNEEKFESLSTLRNYLKINEYARTPVTDWIKCLTVTSDKISFQQKPFCPLMAFSASRIGDHDKPAVRRQNFIRGEPPSCRKVPIPMHYIYA